MRDGIKARRAKTPLAARFTRARSGIAGRANAAKDEMSSVLFLALRYTEGRFYFGMRLRVLRSSTPNKVALVTDRAIQILMEIANAAQQYSAQFQPPRVMTSRFRPPISIVEKLANELTAIPEVGKWEKKRYSTFNMVSEIDVSCLAASMVERVVDGVAANMVFDDLMDLLSKRTSRICVIMGIAGISIDTPLNLAEGVRLMPPSMLPATKMREDMFDLDRVGQPVHRGSIVMGSPPSVAMAIDLMMTAIHDGEIDYSERKAVSDELILKQERALAALTLSGTECAPFAVFSSSWIDHPAYSYSGFGVLGYGRHHGMPPHKNGTIDSPLAQAVYAQLSQLKEPDWAAINRATDRLRRSRSHMSEADRAVDLGIAIEMTLLHDLQEDRGELKYRTALRGAWLLGKTGADRRSIFNALRAAYDARSISVHTGKLTKKRLIETLPVADDICAHAIRAIVDKGGFPSQWESLVIDDPTDVSA